MSRLQEGANEKKQERGVRHMDMVRAIQRVESEDVSIGLATQTPPGRDTCDKMSHLSRTTQR